MKFNKNTIIKYSVNLLEVFLGILLILIIINYNKFTTYTNLIIKKYLSESQTLFYLVLIFTIIINLLLYKYSVFSAGIVFIIFTIIIKNNINNSIYIENFFNTEESENYIKETVLLHLKEQVENDPNITDLEKDEIIYIYDKYFLKSDNLQRLMAFNNNASKFNPVDNNQKLKDILNFYK
jgi:hypothetical protein